MPASDLHRAAVEKYHEASNKTFRLVQSETTGRARLSSRLANVGLQHVQSMVVILGVDFTSISFRFHSDFTSMSLRFHFDFTSIVPSSWPCGGRGYAARRAF
jgi:hypothetical protein